MAGAVESALPEPFAAWFAGRGWRPHAHQLEMLAAARAGESALLIAPTGGGKTLAGFLPSLIELDPDGREVIHFVPELAHASARDATVPTSR